MEVVKSLIQSEKDGSLSFGDFSLKEKQKKSDFKHEGDLYKVKSFYEITRLERNGAFVYESVPGTSVFNLNVSDKEIDFSLTGKGDIQITMELQAEKEYEVIVAGESLGVMKTNLGGKLTFSVEADENSKREVKIVEK
ncbi:MAG: endosialidase [Lachnospiraceae bacterium]|nr:endosialidase [Lachnospiraceae bacterium]